MHSLRKFRVISATDPHANPVHPGMEGKLPEEIPALRAFLRRLVVGCPGLEVDDLQQQTMNRALQFQCRYDATRPLRPWLHTVAFRVFLDARAKAKVSPLSMGEQNHLSEPTSGATTPTREEIDSLLNQIPAPQGEILRRFHLQGQSVGEIASALQLPSGTVKSHLHRARQTLARDANVEAWL